MPHITIEYSKMLGEIIDVPRLVKKVHQSLVELGVGKERIRTKAHSCNYCAVGDHELRGHMLHATVLIMVGRDAKTKRQYAQSIFKNMKDSVEGIVKDCAVSLEIREMEKDSYYQ